MDLSFWKSIAERDYAVPTGQDLDALVDILMSYLGSTDPTLRDDVAYTFLAQWIVHRPQISHERLHRMQARLIAGLTQGIVAGEPDSVFLRSFSMLILGLVVCRDIDDPFLNRGEVEAILYATLEYLNVEYDFRGYVPGKGWAHALAHTADTLKFLARNKDTSAEDHARILNGIAMRYRALTDRILVYDEDERMAQVFVEIIKRDAMPAQTFVEWVSSFVDWKMQLHADVVTFEPMLFGTHQNIKHLLRSFYFQLLKMEQAPPEADVYRDSIPVIKASVLQTLAAFNF